MINQNAQPWVRVTFRAGDPVTSWALVPELWLAAQMQSDGATLTKASSQESVRLEGWTLGSAW